MNTIDKAPLAGDADRWYREPLVHFLLLGALLFAANAAWDRLAPAQESIVVSEARVRTLAENFRRTWQRLPTAGELDGLIDEHIRDEVLTREAQRLGLDRDDTVIRRRLRQKIEIVTEEAAAAVAPTEAQLQAFLDSHAEAFRGEAQVAFAQVFLDPSKRGERIDDDARSLLARLNAPERRNLDGSPPALRPPRVTATEFSRLGDQLFVLKSHYGLTGQREIAASFGAEFASALPGLAPGQWIGPVASGYGVHLVRIDQVIPAPAPPLEQVRALVEREWRNVQRKDAAQAQYERLRAGYRILIKKPVASDGEKQPS